MKIISPTIPLIYRIMRFSAGQILLLLFFYGLSLAKGTHAQILDKEVSVHWKSLSLKKALQILEEKTDVRFVYSASNLELDREINYIVTNEKLGKILDQILNPLSIQYIPKVNNYILLKHKSNNVTITGTITNQQNIPLEGVNVLVKGSKTGTSTDANGQFVLANIQMGSILVFSYIGYQTQQIQVNGEDPLIITLLEDVQTLDELVLVGYGNVKKSDLTGSVSQIKTDALESIPVYNIEQALKSQAAGVMVRQNSGNPGGRIEVRIRGGNSMIGGNQPLYVVDGFPVTGDISFLNPSDIESMDILKDASATAIYGSRGANGVVMIKTRKGSSSQKSKVEIHSLTGIQFETNRYKMLDAHQYAEVVNEWLLNSGQQPYFDLSAVGDIDTDWQDFIFRDAMINNHTLRFSGGSENTTFAISGNYYDQKGIIKFTGIKKGLLHFNIEHKINERIRLGVNANLARSNRDRIPVDNAAHGGSILSGAMAAPPTLPVYDAEGKIVRIDQIYSFGSIGMNNPAIYFPPYKSHLLNNTVIGNFSLDVKITDELSFKALTGLEYENLFADGYNPIIFMGDRGSASQSGSSINSFLTENILSYLKEINNHTFNIIGGYTFQNYVNRNFGISTSGFANNITENYDLGAAEIINVPSSGLSEWKLASWLSRLNYTFDNKYMLTASIRADGSSRFGKNNKWGVFPSGAVAWRISEEPFMKEIGFINSMKIRASYGITGNTALSPYQSLDRLSSVKYIYGNHTEEIGYVPAGIANSNLKWESTAQLDIGLDLSLLKDRLNITFDYYKKETSDLLASVPLPPSIGFESSLQNIGKIENKGVELALDFDILESAFKWNVSTQFSANRNEVLKLAGGSDIYGGGVGIFGNISLAREGRPLGVFYGFIEDGLDDEGYIKYLDLNNDGLINTSDRSIIGNPYPDFFYGFNSNFEYKGINLNLFFEGVHGNDLWWASAATHLNSFQRGSNQFEDLYGNFWTADNPNPNAKYPKVSSTTQISDSDRFVKDGSYFRLKSLKVAYTLPKGFIKVSHVDFAQVYFLATNLFTITDYPGIDPDVNTAGKDSGEVTSRITTGVDESSYPVSKVFSLGVKLNF